MASILCLLVVVVVAGAQEYSVTDIDCTYSGQERQGVLSATLRKPQGFQGEHRRARGFFI